MCSTSSSTPFLFCLFLFELYRITHSPGILIKQTNPCNHSVQHPLKRKWKLFSSIYIHIGSLFVHNNHILPSLTIFSFSTVYPLNSDGENWRLVWLNIFKIYFVFIYFIPFKERGVQEGRGKKTPWRWFPMSSSNHWVVINTLKNFVFFVFFILSLLALIDSVFLFIPYQSTSSRDLQKKKISQRERENVE